MMNFRRVIINCKGGRDDTETTGLRFTESFLKAKIITSFNLINTSKNLLFPKFSEKQKNKSKQYEY